VGKTLGPYQRVFVNLAAPRKAIKAAVKKLPRGPQGIQLPRHDFKRIKKAFELWDDSDPLSLSAEEVASRKFGIPKSTAYNMLNEVSQLIYGMSYLKSRPLRQLIPKKKKALQLRVNRELEIALQQEYQRRGAVTIYCPVPALVDEVLAAPSFGESKSDPLQYFKKLQRIEDELIRKIDLMAYRGLQEYDFEKPAPVKPEPLRVRHYFSLDEFTNFVKRGSDERQTNHPCSVKSSESHRR